MERDSIKWLIAGLAGALFTIVLFVGVGVAIFLRLEPSAPEKSLAAIFDGSEEVVHEDEEEAREAEEEAKQDAENAAWEERLGLDSIYTRVYLLQGTHYQLYHEKNFKLIEEQLAAELANTATPFDRYRYSASIEDLTVLHNEDLQTLLGVADEWVKASPDSHYPYLLRGKLNSELAWEYRGDGFIGEVSRSGLRKFEQLNKRAKEDLEIAQKLNPNDPEVPAALADAVAPIEGMRALRRCYDQTLALNPHHVHVRYTMMTYLQPQWYGNWREFDAYMAEIDAATEAFPYLFTVRRDGYSLMEAKGKKYEGVWDSPETYKKAAAAFKAQAEQNPGELTVLASAAYFAIRANDLASAVGYFERIGNQYPRTDEFPSLNGYHWWRLHAMVEYSDDPGIVGTPREKELLDAALALDVEGVKANGFYMAYLTRLRDDAQTKEWWDSLDGGYYKTSDLGTPPNYDVLQAMYLASRSDDQGVQGTDEEQPTLDQALALAPDNAYVRLVYAEHHITRDQFDEARVHLERAREVDPAYLPALLTMGWLNYHQKRYDDAITAANQFLASGTSKYAVMNAFDAKEIVELSTKKKAAVAAPNLNATG